MSFYPPSRQPSPNFGANIAKAVEIEMLLLAATLAATLPEINHLVSMQVHELVPTPSHYVHNRFGTHA
ncbi:uncharacterized protein MAM_05861 [Metarhizium album ARSEF 1941]|uniref:Uncharacterized protein n=1 Tax=Metarhizium album (strain ARSEF 1941) TaxID=1081103 RepID=A0A0B2WTN4_METAS|nr:uncharacterized protein MAM_05861 [Metarhizium album ARSEF 1941]KHN96275.1 hypothetical protein MAM_05861 [Metarhizium album ARSEF 1941]